MLRNLRPITSLLAGTALLLVCAATLPVVATRQAQPGLKPVPRLQLKRLFALAPTAGAGALLSGLAMGAF